MDGIINVYKEKGYTSFDVVAKLRKILMQKRIGHTGTLDPDAEGVLPVCIGAATKACDMLTEKSKEYEAVLLFGIKTDTQDISGNVLERKTVDISEQEAVKCLLSFIGPYKQMPPMYSAVKINGKKLYELARKGKEIERPARDVEIYSLKILEICFEGEEKWIRFQVSCSKGTYIRTLCEDAAEKAGCCGCMKSLVRTRAGCFSLKESLTLAEIEEKFRQNGLDGILQPVERFFLEFPEFYTTQETDLQLHNGNKLKSDWLVFKDFYTALKEEQAVNNRRIVNDGQAADNKQAGNDKKAVNDEQAADNSEAVNKKQDVNNGQAADSKQAGNDKQAQKGWYRAYDSTGKFYAIYAYDAAQMLYRNIKMFPPETKR